MRRRSGRWSVSGPTYTWAVILIGSGALAASLLAFPRIGALQVAVLCLAGAAAHAFFLPVPAGGDQTLAPIAAGAGLTLFGAPAAALAMAVGGVAGQMIIRRRRPIAGLFGAAQWVLATLAAGAAAYAVNLDIEAWTHPVLVGGVNPRYLGGVATAAAAAAVISVALTGWRITLARPTPFAARPAWPLVIAGVNAAALFGLGTLGALVLARHVPPEALALAVVPALAVAAALAYGSSRHTAAELEVAHSATADLSRSVDVEEIGRMLAAGIDQVLPADVVLIHARPPGDDEDCVVYYRGPGGFELARQLEPGGLAGSAVRNGRPIRIGNYERDPRRNPRADVVFGRGIIRSLLAVPIVTGQEAWGTVTLAHGERHAFSSRDERFVGALADRAAAAIRSLHLQEHARRQARRLDAMQHGILPTDAAHEPDEVARQIVGQSAVLLGARHAFLARVDSAGRELRGAAAVGVDAEMFLRMHAPLDGVAADLQEMARVARERRSVAFSEAQVRASPCPSLQALPDARGALAVPVMRQGRLLGVLMVVRAEPSEFIERDIATLEAVASQGAALLEHASHYQATEARLRRMEELIPIFHRLAAAQDLPAVFAAAAEGVRVAFGVDRCLLLAWDGRGPTAQVFTAGLADEFGDALRRHLLAGGGRFLVQPGRMVTLADLAGDPRFGPMSDDARREGVRAATCLSMRAGDEFVGLLLLAGPISQDRADARLAEALAEHAAASLRNARLLTEGTRRLTETKALNRILAAVSSALTLTDVYRVAVTELSEVLGVPRISLYRVSGQSLSLVVQAGAPDAPPEISTAEGVAGRAARTGRPEYVASVREDPDHVPGHPEVTSLAAIPILQEGGVTGLLVAEGTSSRPVTAQHSEFLSACAQQLSVAIRNAAFYEDQRRAHDELRVLYEAARAVSGALELHTVLDNMISVTCRAFGYDSGAIMMVDPGSGDLVVEAGYGHRETIVGRRLPAGTGIGGWVARTGAPMQAADIRDDARHAPPDDAAQSELAVPLIAEGKVLGVFSVASARPGAFGPPDLRLLTTLASYAVVGIQNARLYETAQRLAVTDGLTELYNHRYLYESLERVLERARREEHPVGLIMLEIDNFKRYNDSYGHQSGDEALRTVAALLRRSSRPSDIVARYGGDEFMIVLPGTSKAAALETAERIRRAVEAYPLILADEIITSVTLSVGVGAFPHDGDTVDLLVEAVDRAQYAAKRSGGNKVHIAPAA